MEDYQVCDLMRRGIEHGRKYGAVLDLYVEISRICSASEARATAGSMVLYEINRAILSVSPDLRAAGSVLVLMSKYMRNAVGEMIMRVDAYNSKIEARGGEKVMLDESARNELSSIKNLEDEICAQLKVILDQEPQFRARGATFYFLV